MDENDDFLVCNRLWFVGPRPLSDDAAEIRRVLARADTPSGAHIVAFTDLDLANSFVEFVSTVTGQKGLKPFAFHSDDLALFIAKLIELGETRLGIDPGEKHVRAIALDRILEGIKNRRR